MYCSHITTWREVRLRTCCPRPHTTELPLQRSKGPVRTSPKSKFHWKTSDPSYVKSKLNKSDLSYVKSSKNECQTIKLCLWMWRIGTADQLFVFQDKKFWSVKTFHLNLNTKVEHFSIVTKTSVIQSQRQSRDRDRVRDSSLVQSSSTKDNLSVENWTF